MQKIVPHLWFDREAKDAAEFYTSVFSSRGVSEGKASKVKDTTTLHNTPSGAVDIVTIELAGQEFVLFSAGPLFKFNPSVSFLIACGTKREVDGFWEKLSKEGSALMELGEYPFSERYGWIQDKYGVSWQVIFMGDHEITQKVIPMLLFIGDVCGKTEEAINFYSTVFRNSNVGDIFRYGRDEAPDREGTVKYAGFTLEGQEFAAMDSARSHAFAFNEAISLMVLCDSQIEIDYYWDKLSAVPSAEQCGWLKDKFGLSWQISPTVLDEMVRCEDQKRVARVTEAFLKMKKFDINELKRAYGQVV
jgi:predicted 3-demethylubiquinone-9 3-methyltransferase (glyoxalase superfamily)